MASIPAMVKDSRHHPQIFKLRIKYLNCFTRHVDYGRRATRDTVAFLLRCPAQVKFRIPPAAADLQAA
jgi:hypothetical protein